MASLSTSNSKTDTATFDDEIQVVKLALDSAVIKKNEAQTIVDELLSKLNELESQAGLTKTEKISNGGETKNESNDTTEVSYCVTVPVDCVVVVFLRSLTLFPRSPHSLFVVFKVYRSYWYFY